MARPESPSTHRPFEEIPRQPLGRLLEALFTGGGGRIDMRGSLERQHAELGGVVRQIGGPFKFLNLYGPDANRFVLLDPNRIFSARRPWM